MPVVAILASMVVIMVDSVPRIHSHSAHWPVPLEWAFTVIFTVEYALRLGGATPATLCAQRVGRDRSALGV